MLSKEYIVGQIKILKQLFLWKYMSDEEKEQLRQVQTEDECSILMRKLRDKYYDQMINDYEYSPNDEYLDIPLEELELKTKTLYALKRIELNTSGEFVEFVEENGWAKIPRFGRTLAKDIYMQIYDEMSEEEIEKLVKKTKNKGV
jgi:DNA-directed RNA polymerase alpha subunit